MGGAGCGAKSVLELQYFTCAHGRPTKLGHLEQEIIGDHRGDDDEWSDETGRGFLLGRILLLCLFLGGEVSLFKMILGSQLLIWSFFKFVGCSAWKIDDTVDGRNPAPVDMVNTPLITGFYTSQVVVWDFFHQQYLAAGLSIHQRLFCFWKLWVMPLGCKLFST